METRVFSLESQKNTIYDSRSRKYFEEVYKSYANSCYRSATVMLWSVIACDLIFKLQELRDIHNDETASKILSEIESMQLADPYSSKWEKEIIDKVFLRTQLLDTPSKHKLKVIQEHRHLSAHPIIGNDDALFEPTQEMIRSDIRNSIEAILSKPPFLSQKIIDTLSEDLLSVKDLLPSDVSLMKYLDAKYFRSLNDEILTKIFRSLWKLSFRLEDDKAIEGRKINVRVLSLIFGKIGHKIIEAIKSDASHYSNISSSQETIKSLIDFIALKKDVYSALNDSAKELIKPIIRDDISYLAVAFFISETPYDHIKLVIQTINTKYHHKYGINGNFINNEKLIIFKKVCNEFDLNSEYLDFGISCYINSADFDCANIYFDRDIDENIDNYSQEQLVALLDGSNSNFQCYYRKRSRSGTDSLKILKKAKDKISSEFCFSKYTNLPIDKLNNEVSDE